MNKKVKRSNVKKARVLIVDDHPIIRQGLSQLLNQQPDFTICGETEDGSKALSMVAALRPDAVVTDLSCTTFRI